MNFTNVSAAAHMTRKPRQFEDIPQWCVYVLVEWDTIHYIGSTGWLLSRLTQHGWKNGLKRKRSVWYWIAHKEETARMLEEFLVFVVRPPGNKKVWSITREHIKVASKYFDRDWIEGLNPNITDARLKDSPIYYASNRRTFLGNDVQTAIRKLCQQEN